MCRDPITDPVSLLIVPKKGDFIPLQLPTNSVTSCICKIQELSVSVCPEALRLIQILLLIDVSRDMRLNFHQDVVTSDLHGKCVDSLYQNRNYA